MTYLLAISLTTTLCLLWLLHSERSSDDRRALIDGYNDRLDRQEQRFLSERSRWASERRELNQRIQAPEQAVMVYAAPDEDSPQAQHVPLDDDKAWEEHMKALSG